MAFGSAYPLPAAAQDAANDASKPQPGKQPTDAPGSAGEAAAIVAPFLTDATFGVWRIDQSAIDIDATVNKLMALLEKHFAKVKDDRQTLRQLKLVLDQLVREDLRDMAAFLQAGGREAYILVNFPGPDVEPDESHVIIIRVGEGANADDVLTTLRQQEEHWRKEVARGNVWVMNGHIVGALPTVRNRIDLTARQREKLLRDAFEAVEGDPVQFVFVPPAHLARAVEELMPVLPKSLGGGPSTVLTRGARWAAFGLKPPPDLCFRAVVQSDDETAARAFAAFADKFLREYPLLAETAPLPKAIADRLKLNRDGGRLKLSLNEGDIDAMIGDMLAALREAGRAAKHRTSMMNLNAIHSGCLLYAHSHDGAFPPSIGAMLPDDYLIAERTISLFDDTQTPFGIAVEPEADQIAWVNRNTSYAYIPGLKADQNAETIVLFEKPKPGMKQIAVCFNDNHVELLDLADADRRLKAQTGFSIEQWSKVVSGERPKGR